MSGGDVETARLLVHIPLATEGDEDELEWLTSRLMDDLLELDIESAERLTEPGVPDDAKGALGAVGGWLVVNLGPAALRSLVQKVATWATRNSRSVEITLRGDVLKVTGISREQQDRLIDEWLERQGART